MSLRLILMRHAKSDWDHAHLGDFMRPLNPRGRRAAAAVGEWLAAKGYMPDAVYCSAAARTAETCALVLGALAAGPEVTYRRDLYLASAETMLRTLHKANGGTVMLLAHNPGCAILAAALAERAPPHARFDDFPTAATAIFEFEVDSWAAIAPRQGQVVDFIVPRDLNKPPVP